MTQYYKPNRTFGLYNPSDSKPFRISRSKIDLFIKCPRCFYLDRVLGIGQPPGFPFSLNSAVDKLLKKEFDIFRAEGKSHPLITENRVDARPVSHEELDKWRENFVGVQYLHEQTNLLITGAIDDLWINSKGEYIVVDYKSTSKDEEITELNKEWQNGYKRQMEVYQWLLRKNGLNVSDTGYFVYCNGVTDCDKFDNRLEFKISLIPYKGDDSWVEKAITDAYACLNSETIPECSPDCDFCSYVKARTIN